MSEEDGRKMKTSSSSDDKKKKRRKKRKRRKKLGAAHTPQQAALAELKPPEPVPRGQTPKRRAACKKSKEPPREPPLPLASDGDLKEPRPAGARLPPPTPSPTPPDVQVARSAAMEAGRALERHVASVHRGIVFLQREHVTLLAGLHVEISSLKRRCQELSCELDSRFPHRTTAEDEAQLRSRCEAARRLLEERRGATEAARGALRLGGARASELGRSLRRDERRFLDELKRRSHKIAALGRQLQRQKGDAAALCRQLDAARAELRRRPALEDDGGPGERPPPAGLPPARPGVRTERVRACVPRERVTSPQRPRPMPDPALFLPPPRWRAEAADREDDWEDVDEGGGLRGRVDMGGAEGETAL